MTDTIDIERIMKIIKDNKQSRSAVARGQGSEGRNHKDE